MRWMTWLGCGLTCALALGACGTSTTGTPGYGPGDGGGSAGTGGAGGSGGVTGGGGSSPADGSAPKDGAAGSTDSSGGADAKNDAGEAGPSTTLPALTVSGNLIKDPGGNTIILRGVDIPDIGQLYASASGVDGITGRIDRILSTSSPSLDSHVVRLPVYPETWVNDGSSAYSPMPYPVGPAAPAGTKQTILSSADYISTVLKPAVDYATSKNLYAIIDFHQTDNVTTGESSADAVAFWTAVAPVFASYTNVLYEAFNEPIDSMTGWNTAFQTAAQSWINTIRGTTSQPVAPNNLIIVGSPSWSQHPEGALTLPLTGGNLVFTAHTYPSNFPGDGMPGNVTFQTNITTAIAAEPVFVTEWGYQIGTTTGYNVYFVPDDTWATNLQTYLNSNGASWSAWCADDAVGPPMFTNGGTLNDFGTFVQNWLAADVNMNWVQ
jgi:endoglucanase